MSGMESSTFCCTQVKYKYFKKWLKYLHVYLYLKVVTSTIVLDSIPGTCTCVHTCTSSIALVSRVPNLTLDTSSTTSSLNVYRVLRRGEAVVLVLERVLYSCEQNWMHNSHSCSNLNVVIIYSSALTADSKQYLPAYTAILQRAGIIEFTVTPSCLYSTCNS